MSDRKLTKDTAACCYLRNELLGLAEECAFTALVFRYFRLVFRRLSVHKKERMEGKLPALPFSSPLEWSKTPPPPATLCAGVLEVFSFLLELLLFLPPPPRGPSYSCQNAFLRIFF